MPRQFRGKVIAVALSVAAALAILGSAPPDSLTEVVPAVGGTYVEAVVGQPQYINPVLSQLNEVDDDLASLVFSGLTRLSPTGEVVPDLARSWEVSADGSSYTFHLRPDARWHDGRAFSADDVLFTIKLIQRTDFPGPPALAEAWRDVSVSKVDDVTVRFSLKQPFAPFLEYTTLRLLPSHLLDGVSAAGLLDESFNARPVGTGPFRVVDSSLSAVTLEPFAGYYGPRPYLDRVQFRFYPSAASALEAYRKGEVLGIRSVPAEQLAEVRATGRATAYAQAESSKLTVLILNTLTPPFSDKAVRQAISCALDRARLVDAAIGGQGVPAAGPISTSSWAFKPEAQQYQYAPAVARDLLDSAGWHNASGAAVREKDGRQLEFALLTNDQPDRIRAAEEVGRQLASVGMKVDVQAAGWTGLVQDFLVPRSFQAVLTGQWAPSADPDPYPFWHSSQIRNGLNFAGWANPRADALLDAARKQTDHSTRLLIYQQFQDLFAAEMPSVPLYYPTYTYAVDNGVHGVSLGLFLRPSDRLSGIADWYLRTRRVARPR